MAFLDNSGDIILDAVLTDTGRKRLAMGDGSFVVSKFALGDDEIDYSLYVPTTGSGYQDLRILKLSILESFTDNTTALKSKLITYANNTLTHLPVVRLNGNFSATNQGTATGAGAPIGGFFMVSNDATGTQIQNTMAAITPGFLYSNSRDLPNNFSHIVVDQGLVGTDVTIGYLKDENVELVETSYIVEIDYRLVRAGTPSDNSQATPNFIDDDNIASYYFVLGTDNAYFAQQPEGTPGGTYVPEYVLTGQGDTRACAQSPICIGGTTGKIGTRFAFSLLPSLSAATQSYLFDQMGSTVTLSGTVYKYIDTVVRITGFTTGYRTDIPIRILRFG